MIVALKVEIVRY